MSARCAAPAYVKFCFQPQYLPTFSRFDYFHGSAQCERWHIHIACPIRRANRASAQETPCTDHERQWRTQQPEYRPQPSGSTQHHRCVVRDHRNALVHRRRHCVRRAGRQTSTSGTRCLVQQPHSRKHGLAMLQEVLSKLFRNQRGCSDKMIASRTVEY